MIAEREIQETIHFIDPLAELDEILPVEYRPTRSELEAFRTKEEWLATPDSPMGSDHSTDHPARVLIWEEILTRHSILNGIYISMESQEALRWFAAVHDTQRFDDDYDLEHGERAAQFLRDHFAEHMSAETLAEALYLCRAHVPHDHEQPPLSYVATLAKDADALDRGRGKRDFDPQYARHPATVKLYKTAQILHDLSMQMNTGDNFNNVMQAAIQLGIVLDR